MGVGCGPPEHAAALPAEATRTGARARTLHRDLVTGELVSTNVADDGGVRFLDRSHELDARLVDAYTVFENQPLSARVEGDGELPVGRGDWRVRIVTHSGMTADAENFLVTNALDAYEGEVRIYARTWSKSIPRDCV